HGEAHEVPVAVVESGLFDGPEDGALQQYGEGSTGAPQLLAPTLGASGPLRPGSTTAALRLVRGTGSAALALISLGPDQVPVSGLEALVSLATSVPLPLPLTAGPSSTEGTLESVLPLGGALTGLAGNTLYAQAFCLDPSAPAGLRATNGLELQFGL
ncbi:MAG: hypothetical protein AAFZ65_15535, partial [Planctomycetota bacterium]